MLGHFRRGGGGVAIDDYESFAAMLNDLHANADAWRKRGQAGKRYVAGQFGSRTEFTRQLQDVVETMRQPLVERMKSRGLTRAEQCSRPNWRHEFGRLIEELLDESAKPRCEDLVVTTVTEPRQVAIGVSSMLLPIRVTNRGNIPALSNGPARHLIRASFVENDVERTFDTPLPAMIPPGKAATFAVAVPVPGLFGTHELLLRVMRSDRMNQATPHPSVAVRIAVVENGDWSATGCFQSMLMEAQESLIKAQQYGCLPDDYVDVTQGKLSRWKAWIKRKLLGNFKHAYVDVLSRQQSEFNRHVLTALQQLAECCAALESTKNIDLKNERSTSSPSSRPIEFTSSDRDRP